MGIFDVFMQNVEKLEAKRNVKGLIKVIMIHEDESVTMRAVKALKNMGDNKAVELLIQALKKENWSDRALAAYTLGEIGDEAAVEPLIQTLKDEIEDVRSRAAGALLKIGETAVESLIDALKDNDQQVRAHAALVLGKLKKKMAVYPLIDLLKDKESLVRVTAADSLGSIKDKLAVKPLIDLLNKKDAALIKHAKEALKKINTPEALEALENVEDKEMQKRKKTEKKEKIEKLTPTSKQAHKSRKREDTKEEMDETKGVFVVIRRVSDREGNVPIRGIEERMRVERKCVYCDYLQDPRFDDPQYPMGGAYCDIKNGATHFNDSCDRFKPDDRSIWWLQGEYMAGRYPRVAVWWTTYSDEDRQKREKKRTPKKEVFPLEVTRIDVDLDMLFSFEKPDLYFYCLSPDGKYLAGQYESEISSDDYKLGLWDIQERKQILEIPLQNFYTNFCFSPSGKLLAATQSYNIVSIWDMQKGKEVNSAKVLGSLNCLIFTTDERYLVVGFDRRYRTWDIQRNIVSKDNELKSLGGSSNISCLSVSADGKYLAAGTEDQTIYIIDTENWQEFNILRRHETRVRQVDFHPNSQLLVSVSEDNYDTKEKGRIKLWDIYTAQEIKEFPSHGRGCFDATGKLVACKGDKGIDLWNISSGAKIHTLPIEKESYGFCFSSKANILAVNIDPILTTDMSEIKIFDIKIKQQ